MFAPILGIAMSGSLQAANVILNGDFESGSKSDTVGTGNVATELGNMKQVNSGNNYGPLNLVTVDNWTVTVGSGSITNRAWHVIDNLNLLGAGATNNLMRIDGGNTNGTNKLQYTQTISLSAGDSVSFSLLALAEFSDNTLFATLTSGGTTIDLLGAGGTLIDYDDAAAQIVNSGAINIINSGDYTLEIWADQSNSTANHLVLDNVLLDVTAVPEPSSTALLGLGSIALFLRRRK